MADENIGIDDLVDIPTGELSEEEKTKYDGSRTKIARAFTRPAKTRFTKDATGKSVELPLGQTIDVVEAVLETESLGLNSIGQPIAIQEKFALKRHPVSGKWGPSQHEKGKGKKLFNKLKVNSFKECIGKEIVVVKKVSEKNPSKTWLGFSI